MDEATACLGSLLLAVASLSHENYVQIRRGLRRRKPLESKDVARSLEWRVNVSMSGLKEHVATDRESLVAALERAFAHLKTQGRA